MGIKNRFVNAGRELVKANFGNVVKSFTQSIVPSIYNSADFAASSDFGSGLWWFSEDGKHDVHFNYTDVTSSLTAYRFCPPLTAIINRKAQAYINGKTYVLNTQGKGKGKESTGDIANKLRILLAKPNPFQSWRHFEAQNYIYQQLSGFCVVLPLKPVGFSNLDATALWNIPPWMLEIREKINVDFITAKTPKDLIDSIVLIYNGVRTPLPLDDIYIFKDFSPSISSAIFPESRVHSLRQVVNNIIGTYESRGVLIDKRGPSIVISSGKTDESGMVVLQPHEKKELEEQFMTRYGLKRNQARAIITTAPIKLDTVGFSTKDLMLFEEIEDDIMRVCDGYAFPYQLLASSKGTTFANVNDAKKLLYQDAIIPESCSMYEQWNQFFGLAEYNITLDKDYKHIAALQEDQVQEATARYRRNQGALIEFQNNNLTLNEWRALNNDDPLNNGLGDFYYYELIAKGIVFGQGVSGSSVPDTSGVSAQDSGQANNGATTAN